LERLIETVMGFNTVLTLIRVLKYFSLHPQMGLFRKIMKHSSRTMFWLCIVFGLMFFAYAIAFHVAFRHNTKEYSAFGNSLVALTGAVLGKAKKTPLKSTNPFLGHLLYISFVVVIFFIFLKLFITTLSESYTSILWRLRCGVADKDNNLYLDEDDERWELIKAATARRLPWCSYLPKHVSGIHEARKKNKIKNALEDAELEVHSKSAGQQIARMEAMVMQIGGALGVGMVLDQETDCIRVAYAGEALSPASLGSPLLHHPSQPGRPDDAVVFYDEGVKQAMA